MLFNVLVIIHLCIVCSCLMKKMLNPKAWLLILSNTNSTFMGDSNQGSKVQINHVNFFPLLLTA